MNHILVKLISNSINQMRKAILYLDSDRKMKLSDIDNQINAKLDSDNDLIYEANIFITDAISNDIQKELEEIDFSMIDVTEIVLEMVSYTIKNN